MRYPVYLNYGREVVGWLDTDVDPKSLASCAVVPAIKIHREDGRVEVSAFGMVRRTNVDTTPIERLGETRAD